jgi:hypothetical protein
MSRNSSNKNLIPESNSRFVYVTVPKEELENATRDIIRLVLEKVAQDQTASSSLAETMGVSEGSLFVGTAAWLVLLGAMSLSAIGSVIKAADLRNRIANAIEKVRQQRLYGGIPREEWTSLHEEINVPEIKEGQETANVPLPVEWLTRAANFFSGYLPSSTLQYAAAATALSLMYWVGCWAGGVIGDLVANTNLTKDISGEVAESKRKMLNSLKRLIKAKIPEPFSQAVAVDNTTGLQLIKRGSFEKTALFREALEFFEKAPPAIYAALYLIGFLAGTVTYPSLEKAHPASPDPEQAAVAKALSILSGSPYPVEIDPAEIKEIFKYQQPEKEVGRSAIPMGLAKAAPESNKKRQQSGISFMY